MTTATERVRQAVQNADSLIVRQIVAAAISGEGLDTLDGAENLDDLLAAGLQLVGGYDWQVTELRAWFGWSRDRALAVEREAQLPELFFPPVTSEWVDEAGCRMHPDPDLFHADEDMTRAAKYRRTKAAKRVCGTCPVVGACLRTALADSALTGVWGHTTAKERAQMRANLRCDQRGA